MNPLISTPQKLPEVRNVCSNRNLLLPAMQQKWLLFNHIRRLIPGIIYLRDSSLNATVLELNSAPLKKYYDPKLHFFQR
jgi:hypothetical protein